MKTSGEDAACWFIDNGDSFICESCGRVVVKDGDTFAGLPFFECRPRPGLGDLVKSGLSAIGITEERVSKAIGRPCGCGERAEMLNAVGAKYLGLSPGSTAPENKG